MLGSFFFFMSEFLPFEFTFHENSHIEFCAEFEYVEHQWSEWKGVKHFLSSFESRVSDELIFYVSDVQFFLLVQSLVSNNGIILKIEGTWEIFDAYFENIVSFLLISSGFWLFISMDIILPLIVPFALLSVFDVKTDSRKFVLESASAQVHVFDSFVINWHWSGKQFRGKFPKLVIDAETHFATDYFDGNLKGVLWIDFLL